MHYFVCQQFMKYIPSSLTTRGILSPISLHAPMMPLAMVVQSTIPPNMFTNIAFTYHTDTQTQIIFGKIVSILNTEKINNLCIIV